VVCVRQRLREPLELTDGVGSTFGDGVCVGFAYTGGSRENCSCIASKSAERLQLLNKVDGCRATRRWRRAYLAFPFPKGHVFKRASSTDIYILSGLDEHVVGRDDVNDRGLARVFSDEPDGYWNVVRGLPKRDGQQSVDTKEQLSAAIIESCRD
jgi:hypothetical protein